MAAMQLCVYVFCARALIMIFTHTQSKYRMCLYCTKCASVNY